MTEPEIRPSTLEDSIPCRNRAVRRNDSSYRCPPPRANLLPITTFSVEARSGISREPPIPTRIGIACKSERPIARSKLSDPNTRHIRTPAKQRRFIGRPAAGPRHYQPGCCHMSASLSPLCNITDESLQQVANSRRGRETDRGATELGVRPPLCRWGSPKDNQLVRTLWQGSIGSDRQAATVSKPQSRAGGQPWVDSR